MKSRLVDHRPPLVLLAGKKRSGKDFIADALVSELGYTKYHIVRPWLEDFCRRHQVSFEDYEREKSRWRSLIQAEAAEARRHDPGCMVRLLRAALPALPRPLAVTAVRFADEAALGHELGALVLRVRCRDAVRRQRFRDAGEDPALFDDPFESEVDALPVHYEVTGTLSADTYAWLVPKLWANVEAWAQAMKDNS